MKTTKTYARIVGSLPKTTFAADLVLFTFAKVGRTFECEGFGAVTRAQLDATPAPTGLAKPGADGWLQATPAQRKLLVRKAREYAPFWRSIKAEIG